MEAMFKRPNLELQRTTTFHASLGRVLAAEFHVVRVPSERAAPTND
jgi:hypothetical protein